MLIIDEKVFQRRREVLRNHHHICAPTAVDVETYPTASFCRRILTYDPPGRAASLPDLMHCLASLYRATSPWSTNQADKKVLIPLIGSANSSMILLSEQTLERKMPCMAFGLHTCIAAQVLLIASLPRPWIVCSPNSITLPIDSKKRVAICFFYPSLYLKTTAKTLNTLNYLMFAAWLFLSLSLSFSVFLSFSLSLPLLLLHPAGFQQDGFSLKAWS